jgi:hypothetical protein
MKSHFCDLTESVITVRSLDIGLMHVQKRQTGTPDDETTTTTTTIETFLEVEEEEAMAETRVLSLKAIVITAESRDLQKAVDKLVANDEAIIIVGDFHEKLGSVQSLMASICAKNNLFDTQAHFHGDGAQIPTYARGSTRLDYCLASSRREPYIEASGFHLFNEYIHSDHQASFVNIRLKSFFRLARPDMRFVSTSSPTSPNSSSPCTRTLPKIKSFTSSPTFALTLTSWRTHGNLPTQ